MRVSDLGLPQTVAFHPPSPQWGGGGESLGQENL